MYTSWNTVRLLKYTNIVGDAQHVAYIHTGIAKDRLIIVPGIPDPLRRLPQHLDLLPLQRRQILCFIDDQDIDTRTLALVHHHFNHVGEVVLACLFLI